jgi:hypothetical protein
MKKVMDAVFPSIPFSTGLMGLLDEKPDPD